MRDHNQSEGNISLSQAADPNQAKLTWKIKIDQGFNAGVSFRGFI